MSQISADPDASPAPTAPRSVALLLLSAIGDAVHALPVVASLREAWPQARITWIVQPAAHALVRGHPDVSEFLLFRRELGMRAFADFRRRTKATSARSFDLVLALQVYFKAGLLAAWLRSPRKVGFDRRRARDLNWMFTNERIPPRPPRHVQDQYFEFLEYLGLPVVRRWDLFFSKEERAAQRRFFEEVDGPALAVVLRTTRREKEWPLERYARVLEVAEADLGFRPVLVGSGAPAERQAADELIRRTRARPLNALGDDLRRLAWILDGSAAVLSPDTGPLHIAVALGTPTVGLYGATDPKRVGPYGRFGDLLVDRYTRPGETEPSPELRRGNMERITVEEVVEKLELARRRYVEA